jgi:D-glycero-D-manno-heptose 1,7-bisphosphate phosphatase
LSKKAVLFDRDGVINMAFYRNNKSYPPKTINEVSLFDGVVECIKKIKQAGFMTFIITNQPDVERGISLQTDVEKINNYILSMIDIDKLYICYSSDNNHPDRKPNPGMILEAKKEYNLDLTKSFVIGDRNSDIVAGRNSGCKTILIASSDNSRLSDYTVENINQAADIILRVN